MSSACAEFALSRLPLQDPAQPVVGPHNFPAASGRVDGRVEQPLEEQADSFPRVVSIHMDASGLALMERGNLERAASYWTLLARRSPLRAEGWVGLAGCLLRGGDVRRAQRYLLRALDAEPHFPSAEVLAGLCTGCPKHLLALARRLRSKRHPQEALAVLQAFLRLGDAPGGQFPRYGRMARNLRDDCRRSSGDEDVLPPLETPISLLPFLLWGSIGLASLVAQTMIF